MHGIVHMTTEIRQARGVAQGAPMGCDKTLVN